VTEAVDTLRTELTRVLGEHELQWVRPYVGRCSCTDWESSLDAAEEHRAHVAAKLAEVVVGEGPIARVREVVAMANALDPDDFKTNQNHLPPAFRQIDYYTAFMALASLIELIEEAVKD